MEPTCEIPRGRHLAPHEFPDPAIDVVAGPGAAPQKAVLAGGCFWCVEAVLKEIDGVLDVVSGYSGGSAKTADYDAVCSGRTGHAEVVEVRFDPARVSYGQLLKVFFSVAHDPTQLNRQGADQGTQYRSAIFYHRRRAEAGGRGLHPAAQRGRSLRLADRHRGLAAGGLLRGRGLPPGLRGEAPHAAVRPVQRGAQGEQAAQALRGATEGVDGKEQRS